MKKIYSCLLILPFVVACTNESTDETITAKRNLTAKETPDIIVSSLPANNANPYDQAGKIHNEIWTAYGSTATPATMQAIVDRVETLANSNAAFVALLPSYHPVSPLRLQYILDNPSTSFGETLNASGLSAAAQQSLKNFADGLLPICAGDALYGEIYNYITAYEAGIVNDKLMLDTEKKVILTTTSIIRYAAFNRKRPKKNTDLDWEINVTHLTGGVDGSGVGTAESITSALSLGIANHK